MTRVRYRNSVIYPEDFEKLRNRITDALTKYFKRKRVVGRYKFLIAFLCLCLQDTLIYHIAVPPSALYIHNLLLPAFHFENREVDC